MNRKAVSYTLEALPPLTEAQEANLKALAAQPVSEIDYSNIPAVTPEQWKHARREEFYRPLKQQISKHPDRDGGSSFRAERRTA